MKMMFMLLYKAISIVVILSIELGQVRENNLLFVVESPSKYTFIIHLFSLLGFIRTISYQSFNFVFLNTV